MKTVSASNPKRLRQRYLYYVFFSSMLVIYVCVLWNTTGRFFDRYMVSAPPSYLWNTESLTANASSPEITKKKTYILLILVGAVRTWATTQVSLQKHLIEDGLCASAETCIVHVVTHFSSTDNRPSVHDHDLRGEAVRDVPGASAGTSCSWTPLQDVGSSKIQYLHFPVEPPYNIATPEEQAAMDAMEKQCLLGQLQGCISRNDSSGMEDIVQRMRLLRLGDPRRYSMWFARAYAWNYAQRKVLEPQDAQTLTYGAIFFTRPDMYWMLPVPPLEWFFGSTVTSSEPSFPDAESDGEFIWVHDSYFSHVPDTWALLPNAHAAHLYFNIPLLVHPGVACLGNPSFNVTFFKQKLQGDLNLTIGDHHDIWCETELLAWSEQILRRRLQTGHVEGRLAPMGTTILRPPKQKQGESPGGTLECFALSALCGYASYAKTYVTLFSCALNQLDLDANWTRLGQGKNLELTYPYRWRSVTNPDTCLAWNHKCNLSGKKCQLSFQEERCAFPFPSHHLFGGSFETAMFGFSNITLLAFVFDQNVSTLLQEMIHISWTREYVMPLQYEPSAFHP